MVKLKKKKKERKKFIYKPLSIKEILREMKDSIDLMIDLSFSTVMFGKKSLYNRVEELESKIHELTFLLNFQIIQTQMNSFEKSKSLEPLIIIGYSIDKIADALTDIAHTVDIVNLSYFSQMMWELSLEHMVMIKIEEGSELIGKKIDDINFRAEYNIDLVVHNRENDYYVDDEKFLKQEDKIIVRGEISDLEIFSSICNNSETFMNRRNKGKKNMLEYYGEGDLKVFKKIVVDFIKITTLAESMVDIAFAAMFFSNQELAEDVEEMEEMMDELNVKFESDVLKFVRETTRHAELQGILRIVFSCELISDACLFMVENILKGFTPHPILRKVFDESGETVVRERVANDSILINKKFALVNTKKYSLGFDIIAIRRNDDWDYNFSPQYTINAGDLIIAIGPIENKKEWIKMVNPSGKSSINKRD